MNSAPRLPCAQFRSGTAHLDFVFLDFILLARNRPLCCYNPQPATPSINTESVDRG